MQGVIGNESILGHIREERAPAPTVRKNSHVDNRPSRRPRGLRVPCSGDTGSFTVRVNVGPEASMSALVEVTRGLEAMTDVGRAWGAALARSAAMWDLNDEMDRNGPRAVVDAARREHLSDMSLRRLHRGPRPWDPEWFDFESPELAYLRDVRANRLLGHPPRVRALTYANPLELILMGSGLLLAGTIMAGRFARDWSANRRIGQAEARKAEAEARVAESWADREEAVTDAVTTWLSDEARRTATPLPIGDMSAITARHNFADLRRVIERPVSLELPRRLDPTASEEGE